MKSLRRRFVLAFGTSSALAWLLLLLWQGHQVRAEIDRLYDEQLAENARTLAALLHSESLEYPAGVERPIEFDRFVAAELRFHLRDSDISARRTYQIAFGNPRRIVRSDNAPARELAPAGHSGFGSLLAERQTWRTYSATADGSDGVIEVTVAEPLEQRRSIVRSLITALTVPVVMSLALLLWLLWWSMSWGLRPLIAVTRQIGALQPERLAAMEIETGVVEIQPLIAALNGLIARLAAASQFEHEFTANAAHQLRTPLAAIKVQAQVALGAHDAAQRQQALRQVIGGIDRATRLVEQLLSLARLEADMVLHPHSIDDLRSLVAQLCENFALPAKTHAITLANDVPVAMTLNGDPELLRSALDNLVDNAIRYTTHPGTVRISAARVGPHTIEITVDDEGLGVAPEDLPLLTRRFARLSGTRDAGSGIGLAIVARIAELHHGQLEFGASPAGGLRVTLRLPA